MSSIDLPLDIQNENNYKEHKILLIGEIDSEISEKIVGQLYDLEDVNLQNNVNIPIKLLINSPGGDLYCSQMICDVMNEITTPVYTYSYGQSCSGGFIIFMNGERGYRTSGKYTQFMTHRFSTSMEGSQSDFKDYQIVLDQMLDRLVNFYKDCTDLDENIILEELLNEKNVYLSPLECYHYNVVDKIIGENTDGLTREHLKPRKTRRNNKPRKPRNSKE